MLAIVLLIGLIGWLIVDAAAFNTEKTVIADMITAWAKEAEGMMILPEDIQQPGEKAPKDAIARKMEQNNAVLGKYLTNDSISWSLPPHQNIRSSLESAFEQNNDGCAYVTECTLEIVKVEKLKKLGANIAVGNITVRAGIRTIGQPMFLRLFYTEPAGTNYGGAMKEQVTVYEISGSSEIDTEAHSYTSEVTYIDVYFKKTDGTWKVAGISGYNF